MDRQRTRRLEAEQNGADVARIVDTIGVQSRLRNSDALRRGNHHARETLAATRETKFRVPAGAGVTEAVAADVAGLRVPADVIADFELGWHDGSGIAEKRVIRDVHLPCGRRQLHLVVLPADISGTDSRLSFGHNPSRSPATGSRIEAARPDTEYDAQPARTRSA